MPDRQAVEEKPVIADAGDGAAAGAQPSRLPISTDIVAGIAGVIFIVVLAWLLLTMAGVLG